MEEPTTGPEQPEPLQADAQGSGPSDAAEAPDGADGAAAGPAAPGGPEPLGVPVTPTGLPAVDTQLARLGDVDHLAVGGHLPVYEDVHRGLRDTLASLDQQPGPRPGPNDIRS